MLSKEDNELLSRVGPGTPMGNLMRQYWLPVLTSSDLEPDGPPLRVRLLSENLIAFRTTSAQVGLIGDLCPHRCASLFFGRNEEDGLRCIYHGWKFDVTGACVDQPGEPEESAVFKTKVFATAYPCQERNGIIWTYMGPRKNPPALPELEANIQAEPSRASRTLRSCNWLQGLEGDIDTVHSEYLHSAASINVERMTPGSDSFYRHRLRTPFKFTAVDTEFGASYGAYRPAEENTTYWRTANFLFPCFTQTPGSGGRVRFWVPLDDEHTMFWNVPVPGTNQTRGGGQGRDGRRTPDSNAIDRGRSSGDLDRSGSIEYLPDSTNWLGRFRPVQNAQNDYLIDREDQRNVTFAGISGGAVMQDQAVTESMGAVLDRTREHLAVSDTMIIRARQRLIAAARAIEDGVVPPGVDNPEVYRIRSAIVILPNGVDWLEGTKEQRYAFVERRPDLSPSGTSGS